MGSSWKWVKELVFPSEWMKGEILKANCSFSGDHKQAPAFAATLRRPLWFFMGHRYGDLTWISWQRAYTSECTTVEIWGIHKPDHSRSWGLECNKHRHKAQSQHSFPGTAEWRATDEVMCPGTELHMEVPLNDWYSGWACALGWNKCVAPSFSARPRSLQIPFYPFCVLLPLLCLPCNSTAHSQSLQWFPEDALRLLEPTLCTGRKGWESQGTYFSIMTHSQWQMGVGGFKSIPYLEV